MYNRNITKEYMSNHTLTWIVNQSVGSTEANGPVELFVKFSYPIDAPLPNDNNYHVADYPFNSASAVCLLSM
ncbi:unnamed protein product [Urochloa humidicola]